MFEINIIGGRKFMKCCWSVKTYTHKCNKGGRLYIVGALLFALIFEKWYFENKKISFLKKS